MPVCRDANPGGSEWGRSPPPDLEPEIRRFRSRFGGLGWWRAAGIAALAALAILAWSSWFTVQPEETGVVRRSGAVARTVGPGLHFKFPYGIETIRLVPTARVLKEKFGFRTLVPGRPTEYADNAMAGAYVLHHSEEEAHRIRGRGRGAASIAGPGVAKLLHNRPVWASSPDRNSGQRREKRTMGILTVVATLAMLFSAAWTVAKGTVWAVRSLRRPPGDGVQAPSPVMRDIVSVILVGLGGLLIGGILVTAVLVAQDELRLKPVQSVLTRVENSLNRVYEASLEHLRREL